jgi:hypothetical protein
MSRKTSGATVIERAATNLLPVALGAGVFIVAFIHVHDVACWAGQPSWASWLIAMTGEAMAIAGLAAITSRRRDNAPIKWAVFVVVAAVLFSGACNLVAVLHRHRVGDPSGEVLHGEPGVWVGLMAVWPVLAFGLVAGLKATKPPHAEDADDDLDRTARAHEVRAAGDGRSARPVTGGAGTAPGGGHMAATATDYPAVNARASGASDHVGVVVPVAAAWTRTGLTGGEDDPTGHNGQHNNGHTPRPSAPAVDDRPALAPTPIPPPREPVRDLPAEPTAPTRPATPAPALAPPARDRATESTGPRLPAVQFRAPEPPTPATDADETAAGEVDVSDLLADGRAIRDGLAKAGKPLNRSTLHAGLKERGQRAGTRKLDALLRELRGEPVGAAR